MTKKQELFLIDIGLQTLLDHYAKCNGNGKPNGKPRKWTAAQHKKFSRSMKKVWDRKRREENELKGSPK